MDKASDSDHPSQSVSWRRFVFSTAHPSAISRRASDAGNLKNVPYGPPGDVHAINNIRELALEAQVHPVFAVPCDLARCRSVIDASAMWTVVIAHLNGAFRQEVCERDVSRVGAAKHFGYGAFSSSLEPTDQ